MAALFFLTVTTVITQSAVSDYHHFVMVSAPVCVAQRTKKRCYILLTVPSHAAGGFSPARLHMAYFLTKNSSFLHQYVKVVS
jgi:hypothetical protein